MRGVVVILFLLIAGSAMAYQPPLVYDSGKVVVRSISMESYRKQAVFQYKELGAPPLNLWDRFWEWVWQWIRRFFRVKGTGLVVNYGLLVLAIGAIVFCIYKVMGMNRMGMFGRRDRPLDYSVEEEDIHTIDFTKAINDAIATGNYFVAIRLLYLQSLKLLSDKQLIEWEPGKTNAIYVRELKAHPQQQQFAQLTNIFDYVWYGKRSLNNEQFTEVQSSFHQFQQQL